MGLYLDLTFSVGLRCCILAANCELRDLCMRKWILHSPDVAGKSCGTFCTDRIQPRFQVPVMQKEELCTYISFSH